MGLFPVQCAAVEMSRINGIVLLDSAEHGKGCTHILRISAKIDELMAKGGLLSDIIKRQKL